MISGQLFFGLDTSNYTTSAAMFDGKTGRNESRILDVPQGALGLRQSDALFLHLKRLPDIMDRLLGNENLKNVAAIAASTRPRAVEESYMPCFLAGESLGKNLAKALDVPFFSFSHQQGHLAAAAWSAGHMELLDAPFLAWHLSGGTTELLFVVPEGKNVKATAIGGTTDISAGQFIDRTGVKLELQFPAGKYVDALAQSADKIEGYRVKINELHFSLSGMENKMMTMLDKGESKEKISRFVLETVAKTVVETTLLAQERYPNLPVLCSGGVASNSLLREEMTRKCGAYFAQPQYSTDNAMGIAILANRYLS